MRAVVYSAAHDVTVTDVPEPKAGEGQVRVKVGFNGICGTDLHEYLAGPILIPTEPHPLTGGKLPVVLGHELLLAECDDRDRRRSARRVKAAGFPREKWLADFDFDANPNINAATIHTLARCEWVKKGEPLCLIGDSGTGKTHLLIGLGTAAAQQGFRVRYALATKLVNELVEAADERQLARTIARYGRVDLLCIDELGYMQLDRRGAEMLFQVLTEREETNSVAIASNESFSGWTKTFADPRLCAAIVDRLTFAGNILETGSDSYRLAQARAQRSS
jgi:DNA replication protein DnaC